MGNSISCCPDESTKQRPVLVMKIDGESLKFKEGTLVKDVLTSYPFHKIIRCCSERSVVPISSQLSCNWLYFMLPEGFVLSDTTYQNLVKSAVTRKLISNEVVKKVEDDEKENKSNKVDGSDNSNEEVGGKVVNYYEDFGYGYKWKPVLKSIPEIASPVVPATVQVGREVNSCDDQSNYRMIYATI